MEAFILCSRSKVELLAYRKIVSKGSFLDLDIKRVILRKGGTKSNVIITVMMCGAFNTWYMT